MVPKDVYVSQTMEEFAKDNGYSVEQVKEAWENRVIYLDKKAYENLNWFDRVAVMGSYYSKKREEAEAAQKKTVIENTEAPKDVDTPKEDRKYEGLYYESQFVSGLSLRLLEGIDQRYTKQVWRFKVNGNKNAVVVIPKASDAVAANGKIQDGHRVEFFLKKKENQAAIKIALSR